MMSSMERDIPRLSQRQRIVCAILLVASLGKYLYLLHVSGWNLAWLAVVGISLMVTIFSKVPSPRLVVICIVVMFCGAYLPEFVEWMLGLFGNR